VGVGGTNAVRLFEHPAFLYSGVEDFLGHMVPFVSSGVDDGEFVFVAARDDNVEALRAEIGERAGAVRLVDTARWHPNPASRLRAFHELATSAVDAGSARLRLVGEPVWPSGPPEFVREWQRYESVLNAVLAPFPGTLVCLYDASRLAPSLLQSAQRTHRAIHVDGQEHLSGEFAEPAEFLRRWNEELMPAPSSARTFEFDDTHAARRVLAQEALAAGVEPERVADLCIAANEILVNAIVHSGGPSAFLAWTEGDRFICQVEDRGAGIADPLAGYRPPTAAAMSGRGLWLARQLVDLLQISPSSRGTAIRLHVARS
jgi:anti-sigma regulatory factor (Ser/Thr protein kinase)